MTLKVAGWILAAGLILGLSVRAGEGTTPAPEADKRSHRALDIEGWQVRVDERLFQEPHQAMGELALKLLRGKLVEIALVVRDDRLVHLREVPIWLDLSCGDLKSMQYHPSVDWLRQHGYAADLARSVHIPQAALWTDREHLQTQPWSLMHELAHAYHDRQLGFDEPRIAAAHARFAARESNQHALHRSGDRRDHYGRTNPMEFFAESTEAYFGTNDFYPFVAGELQEDDPETWALLKEIWGTPED